MGDIDFYSLPVTAGEKVRLRLTDITGYSADSLTIQLFGEDGSLLATSSSDSVAQILYVAESTQTLTVHIFNSAKNQVDYDLYTAITPRSYTVPDGDEGGTLTNGTVADGLITYGDIDFYSLPVTAGEKVRLRLTDITGYSADSLTIQLFGEDGSLLATSSSDSVAQILYVAESTQTLTVHIFNSAKNQVDYDLYTAITPRSYTVPDGDEGGTLTNGTVADGLITYGDIDFYSLPVTAGEKVRLRLADITGYSADRLTLQLFGEDGSLLATSSSGSVAQILYVAESTQTLTVHIFNSAKNQVDYDLYTAITPRSYAVPSGDEGGALTNGAVADGLVTYGDIDFYSLPVTAGDKVHLRLADMTGYSADSLTLQLFGEDGSLIGTSSSGGIAQISYIAENTQTLTAIIFNSAKNQVDYDLYTAITPQYYVVPAGDEGGVLSSGSVVSGLIAPGDIDLFTISATVNNRVSIELTDSTGYSADSLTIQLFGADGSLVAAATSSSVAQISYTPESSENLTVIVFNSSKNDTVYELVATGINECDLDDDGLDDVFEQTIIDADPSDEYETVDDVLPKDDFDGDGYSNIRELFSGSDATSALSVPECLSDTSYDFNVDGIDIFNMASFYDTSDCQSEDACHCDLDSDGDIDDIDLLFFSEDVGRCDCQW